MTKVITGAGTAPDEIGARESTKRSLALRVLRELSAQFEGFEVPDDRLNLNGERRRRGASIRGLGDPPSAHSCHHYAGARRALRGSGRLRGLGAGCGRPARERPGVNRDQRSTLPGASAEVSRSPLRSRKT